MAGIELPVHEIPCSMCVDCAVVDQARRDTIIVNAISVVAPLCDTLTKRALSFEALCTAGFSKLVAGACVCDNEA
jgi:hypothetical protein